MQYVITAHINPFKHEQRAMNIHIDYNLLLVIFSIITVHMNYGLPMVVDAHYSTFQPQLQLTCRWGLNVRIISLLMV